MNVFYSRICNLATCVTPNYICVYIFLDRPSDSIFGKLLRNNMDDGQFMYINKGMVKLVTDDNQVLLAPGDMVHMYKEYHCQVRTLFMSIIIFF